ncbi:hypothetical protein AFK49_000605 [Corynebacterium ulcerans]|nr:hypothetical protein AFK49_000605 [Corynebacterium ulcerans]
MIQGWENYSLSVVLFLLIDSLPESVEKTPSEVDEDDEPEKDDWATATPGMKLTRRLVEITASIFRENTFMAVLEMRDKMRGLLLLWPRTQIMISLLYQQVARCQ